MRVSASRPIRWLPVIVMTLVALGYGLGDYPLLDPDEGRNAEVAREMAQTNNYLVPHLNGLPYVDKPVLYFAVGAVIIEMFGASETTARLPSMLFTFGTLCIVWAFAVHVIEPRAGIVAAVVTATTPLTMAYARTVIFDAALTFFVVSAVVAFYLSVENHAKDDPSSEAAGWWCSGAWTAMALGVLTKGPIAVVVPLIVALPYALWRRRTRALFDPVATLLFVALIAPWVFVMAQQVPNYLTYVTLTETIGRLATPELNRTGPWWYFLPIVFAGSLPWIPIVLTRAYHQIRSRDRMDHRVVFLLCWIVVPLIFFSLSQSKRPQYVLPLIPAVGLGVSLVFTGSAWAIKQSVRVAALTLLLIACVLGTASVIVPQLLDVTPEVSAQIFPVSIALAIASIVGGALAWINPNAPAIALTALALPVTAIPVAGMSLMRAIGHDRSAITLAHAIESQSSDAPEIIAIKAFPLSLPFYLQRTLILSTADGSELTSNYVPRTLEHWRNVPNTTLRPVDWWREAALLCTTPRVFLTKREDVDTRAILELRLPLILETRKYAAYGPCSRSELATQHRPTE